MDKTGFMKNALAPSKDIEEPVPVVAFADWDYYYIIKDLKWRPSAGAEDKYPKITVPRGFVTDLASIPQPFWSILPPTGRYAYPAIIHDFLYWFQTVDREEADTIFKLAMNDVGVASAEISIIFQAVRFGGGKAWDANASARENGERRILQDFPTDVRITWDEWRSKPEVFLGVDLSQSEQVLNH